MTAPIPPDDRGLLLGDGLFETVLWRDGELVLWDRHVARLMAAAETIGLPAPDPAALEAAAWAAASPMDGQRAAVRLTYSAGSGGRGLDRPDRPTPRLFASAASAERPDRPVRLAVVGVRRNDQSPASRLKTLAYLDNVLARRQAQAGGADEAVLLNTRGEVACAAAANIFWISDGVLHTPALSCGVLDGVMRGAVLAQAPGCGLRVREVAAPVSALRQAEAVFITNCLIGVRAASSLDGTDLGAHAGAARLAQAVAGVC